MVITVENIGPGDGYNSAGGPTCEVVAVKIDNTGKAPITTAQLRLQFAEPGKTLSASAPTKTVNLEPGGSTGIGFSSCSLGLSTPTFMLSGTVAYSSPAEPGHLGIATVPATSSRLF